MSNLLLVRHGQASFFEADYDKLSPLGEEQSRKLGEFWLRAGVRPDAVFVGSLKRQARTAEVVAETFARAGVKFPDAEQINHLNEYDADGVMKSLLPWLCERDDAIRKLSQENADAKEPRERYRAFHRLLESVMRVWVEGTFELGQPPTFETWSVFSSRVREGLKRATAGDGNGRTVAVFTSGGPIGVAVQTVMQSPDPLALELNWRVHNASVTEIAFSKSRQTLSAFNSIAHLDTPELLTYR